MVSVYEYCNCMGWGVGCFGVFWILGLFFFFCQLLFLSCFRLSLYHTHTQSLLLPIRHSVERTLSNTHSLRFVMQNTKSEIE